MNNTSPITLCLIVKNESAYLEKCINSVLNIVSDVYIVDTGSTDNTREIALAYTSNVDDYPFNGNFSEARNYALRKVKSPWILFLDADEYFEAHEALKLLNIVKDLHENVKGLRVIRYNFFGNGGWYTSKTLKIFRNTPEIFYEGAIVDSVANSIKQSKGQIVDLPVVLNHFGHGRSVQHRDSKAEIYLNLMLKEIRENPSNAKLIGYAGMINRTLGRFEKALELTSKAIGIDPHSPHTHYAKAQVLRSMGNFSEAVKHYELAAQLDPNDGNMWNMVGVGYLSIQKPDQAAKAFEKALEKEPCLIHVKVNQGILKQMAGEYSEALKLFQEVAEVNPAFLEDNLESRLECDPFREFYFDTILKYAGLRYHIGYCKEMLQHEKK